MAKWHPQSSDYAAIFRSQNPWHQLEVVPAELAPKTHRPLADELWRVLLDRDARRHQIILGPRRVGKSTVMYQTVQQLLNRGIPQNRLWWIRLDHPLLMDWPLGNMLTQITGIAEATAKQPVYVFLDELTYAADWDLWLKTFFDERWPIRLVGTSSASAAIRQRGTESGVGRWEEQFLAPYLFTEFLTLRDEGVECQVHDTLSETISHLIDTWGDQGLALGELRRRFILTGGFPELLIEARYGADEASSVLKSQRVLRSDAIEKALYKDIPQAFNIRDPAKLERLLYTLAGQLTGIFSPNSIAADIELAPKTLETYVTFLERAFLVFTLNNYSSSEETVQRRGKRLYFVDGAVRNAALLRGISPMNDTAEMGLLIENLAASHLRALAYQEGLRLYHWRHKNREVDLVYDHPQEPVAFEITVSKSHSVAGLNEFQERFPRYVGRCYVVFPDAIPTRPDGKRPGMLPLDAFLVAVGSQEQQALANRLGGRATTSDGQLLLF